MSNITFTLVAIVCFLVSWAAIAMTAIMLVGAYVEDEWDDDDNDDDDNHLR